MEIEFKVITGPLKGKKFHFAAYQKISVGRSKKNYFSFPNDNRVSRVHCLIELVPPYNCFIKDLSSRNGTFYGKVQSKTKKITFSKIVETHIKNGDCLRVGKTTLQIFFKKPPEETIICCKCGATITPEQYGQKEASVCEGASYCAKCQGQLEPNAGKQIGNFTIVRKLGEGAMGIVYLVRHNKGHKFALKVARPTMAPDDVQIKRFLREAEYGSKIKHKNIVRYYSANYSPSGFFYIPMEYVAGIDLKEYIEKTGAMSIEQAREPICQLLDALECLHDNNIIHRDIKPANILILEKNGYTIKISDFGIAKNYEEVGLSGLTLSNRAMGTPDYLSPEQLLNAKDVDHRADLYSTAATIYHLLTGQKIYRGITRHNIYGKIMEETPISMSQVNANIPQNIKIFATKVLANSPAT